MLTDTGALGLSLLAMRFGDRPPSPRKTFGYRRVEILAALMNGFALWFVVGLILHEAWGRIQAPPELSAPGVIIVAGVGLAINLVSMGLLHRHREENLNIRGAFLHVAADSLGSIGALIAGVIVWKTGWRMADPLVSLGICGLILLTSWTLVRDAIHILLLGAPAHVDYREVEKLLLSRQGVCCVYDLHIWTISSGREALSAHVVVPRGFDGARELLEGIVADLKNRFGLRHTTLQIEESHDLRNQRSGAHCAGRTDGAGCRYPPCRKTDTPETNRETKSDL